ncbi:hypothetical protein C7B62_22990, partial [Pleurocapsa sp. CCALA 161]|uniref:polysaccharide pyruvyl transferase family protein n=1 Tax=Pleurocapsa sp. CCALA 161 TaxID=2107688 RepID=UPI000D4E610A
LVIGGGALLKVRQNKEQSYLQLFRDRRIPLPRFFDLKQWFSKKIGKKDDKSYFNQFFQSRYMNYPSVGHYIINPDDLLETSSVIYCSCGGTSSFPTSAKEQAKTAFDKAKFIYVRDQIVRERLLDCGVTNDIHTAPDLIVALSDFFDPKVESRKGNEILKRNRVDLKRRVLVFQSYPMNSSDTAKIVEQLKLYSQRREAEIVLMPIGYCHQDHTYLRHLNKLSSGAFKYIGVNSIFEMISVIAASSTFFGTSMHGNITAFSFNKPFLIGPTNRPKQAGFLNMANLDPALELKEWSQANDYLDLIESWGTEYFNLRLCEAKSQVYQVVTKLLNSLAQPSQDVQNN